MQTQKNLRGDEASVVLTKATRKAAELLALTQADIAQILGVSAPTVSRMFREVWLIPRSPGKEWEMALLFLRIFRSLDALVGGNPVHARDWLRSQNSHLKGIPLELCFTALGMSRVAGYLDAMRGSY